MQYLTKSRTLALFSILLASSTVQGDDAISFVYELCAHGMATQPSITKAESDTFCSCASSEVKKEITIEQRSVIRDARNRMRLGQSIPQNFFIKSGLKALVEKSQEYCINSMWPQPRNISKKEHNKFASLANKSVDEFTAHLDIRCEKYPESKERSKCLVDASKEWLKSNGKQYVGIPDAYVTGNDLANTIIEKHY